MADIFPPHNPYLFTATEDLTREAQSVPATTVENVSVDGTTAAHKLFRNGKTYTTSVEIE